MLARKSIVRKAIDFLGFYLLFLLTPIQKLMQHIGREETIITKETVDHIVKIHLPGDILLSHEKQRLTSIFIKGFWDHAAIVTNKNTVIEAVGGGVREVPLQEWLYKKDFVVLIRPTYPSKKIGAMAAQFSFGYIGYKYNFSFSFSNPFRWASARRGVYCSQLVYLCYKKADPDFMKNRKEKILPIDFLRYPKVYDSKENSL